MIFICFQQVPGDMEPVLVSTAECQDTSDQAYIFPWDQDNVTVQDTLNSQPSILANNFNFHPSWMEEGKFLTEEEETLDLSSTSSILSYSYSSPTPPPPTQHLPPHNTRLTILPPRQTVLTTVSQQHQLQQQQQHQQQLQLHSEQLHSDQISPQIQLQQPSLPSTSVKHGVKERRVRARPRSVQEHRAVERPCRVCGEKAGKHSYYGGQVGLVTHLYIINFDYDYALSVRLVTGHT